jgi:peptidoglycan hydrolase-like protein with peptidoglycan-binding domain
MRTLFGEDELFDELEWEQEEEGEVNRSSRDYVRWVQNALNQLLGLRLAVDGVKGAQTRSAIRSFQQRVNLTADGVVGSKTEAALIAAGAGQPPGAGGSSTPTPPAPTPTPSGSGFRSCPGGGGTTSERCTGGAQSCPRLPDLLCVTHIDGIPFEYVKSVGKDTATGLKIVTSVIRNHTQKFTPPAREALVRFVANMRRFGIPIDTIFTLGSLYCRCVRNTNTLSNHSYGDAIDLVGVRWSGRAPGTLPQTIIHNFSSSDAREKKMIQRIDACLRLSFSSVIDYNYNKDHEDHYHCDTNRNRPRSPRGSATLKFVQHVLGLNRSGKLDSATQQALKDFSGGGQEIFSSDARLNQVLDNFFTHIASGR